MTSKLTALEAAKAQLDTAIALCFLNAHPAPIHSLLGAAQELLKGLATAHARAVGAPMPSTHLDATEAALRVMGTARLNDLRNFLKHKVGHAKSTMSIDMTMNMMWTVDCIQSLASMNEPPSSLVELHIGWALDVHFKLTTFPEGTPDDQILEAQSSGHGFPYGTADETIAWLKTKLDGLDESAVPSWFRQAVSAWSQQGGATTPAKDPWPLVAATFQLQRAVPHSSTAPGSG